LWPLKEAEFRLLLFLSPLRVFLVLHVSPYLLFIQSDRRHAVPAAPKVVSPVRLLLQHRVLLEQSYRRLSLQQPHPIRHRQFRRYRDHHVHMVLADAHLQYLHALVFRQRSDPVVKPVPHLPRQYPKPILRTPHYVITALVHYMGYLLPFPHAPSYHTSFLAAQPISTSPPSKTVDF